MRQYIGRRIPFLPIQGPKAVEAMQKALTAIDLSATILISFEVAADFAGIEAC